MTQYRKLKAFTPMINIETGGLELYYFKNMGDAAATVVLAHKDGVEDMTNPSMDWKITATLSKRVEGESVSGWEDSTVNVRECKSTQLDAIAEMIRTDLRREVEKIMNDRILEAKKKWAAKLAAKPTVE